MNVRFVFCILLLCPLYTLAQCPEDKEWAFDNLDGWVYTHQDDNPAMQCEADGGKLRIWTRKGSSDRKKMRTADKIYTTGRYTWKTYVPPIIVGDQTSVGSWLYCDDKHEIDFEVGSGNSRIRKQLKAGADDLVVYMTTQGNPYHTFPKLIKAGWHIFEIDITSIDGKYNVKWLIDGKECASIQQTYGREISFYIYCSVENLKFLGDNPATEDNYGLFDYVKYVYHE